LHRLHDPAVGFVLVLPVSDELSYLITSCRPAHKTSYLYLVANAVNASCLPLSLAAALLQWATACWPGGVVLLRGLARFLVSSTISCMVSARTLRSKQPQVSELSCHPQMQRYANCDRKPSSPQTRSVHQKPGILRRPQHLRSVPMSYTRPPHREGHRAWDRQNSRDRKNFTYNRLLW